MLETVSIYPYRPIISSNFGFFSLLCQISGVFWSLSVPSLKGGPINLPSSLPAHTGAELPRQDWICVRWELFFITPSTPIFKNFFSFQSNFFTIYLQFSQDGERQGNHTCRTHCMGLRWEGREYIGLNVYFLCFCVFKTWFFSFFHLSIFTCVCSFFCWTVW